MYTSNQRSLKEINSRYDEIPRTRGSLEGLRLKGLIYILGMYVYLRNCIWAGAVADTGRTSRFKVELNKGANAGDKKE